MNLPLEIIGQSYISPDYVEVKNSSKVNHDYNSNGYEILTIEYDWDEEYEWIYDDYKETYYDEEFRSTGYLSKEWVGYEWVNKKQLTNNYDISGYISYNKFENWVNNEWFLMQEFIYHFPDEFSEDSIEYFVDMYIFNTIDSIYQTKRQTYNLNYLNYKFIFLTEVLINDSLWENESLLEYNLIDEYYIIDGISMNWVDSAWVNNQKYEFTYTDNYDYESMRYYNWADSSWVDWMSLEYTYTNNNDVSTQTTIFQAYIEGQGDYEMTSLISYSYDEYNNLIEQLQETQFSYSWMEDLITSAYRTSYYYEYILNCTGLVGDINSDGVLNVLDVVTLVVCVLENNCDECFDVDGDAEINILDVVTLVNMILPN